MKPVHSDTNFLAAERNTGKVFELILFFTFPLNPQVIFVLIKMESCGGARKVTNEETQCI